MDWDKWIPALYFLGGLVANAAVGGWLLRGFKADREKITGDIAEHKKALEEHIASAVLVFRELREGQADLQLALGIQGGDITNLRRDYEQMTDLVMVKMPRMVEAGCERAIKLAELRARRATKG